MHLGEATIAESDDEEEEPPAGIGSPRQWRGAPAIDGSGRQGRRSTCRRRISSSRRSAHHCKERRSAYHALLRLCHHASPRRAEGKERLVRGRKEGGLLVAEGGKGSPTTQWGRKEPIGGRNRYGAWG